MTTRPTHPTTTRPIDWALHYVALGWAVLPCHTMRDVPGDEDGSIVCSCKNPDCSSAGKHPFSPLVPQGLRDATRDPRTVATWWDRYPDLNIGVATGPISGILVLDRDPLVDGTLPDLPGEMPDTVQAITGRRGEHYLFAWTPELDRIGRNAAGNVFGPGWDIRGEGGYIVAPPAWHASGRQYEWEAESYPGEMPLATPPEWLIEGLRKRFAGSRATPSDRATGGASTPSERTVAGGIRMPDPGASGQIPAGGRNNSLTSQLGYFRLFVENPHVLRAMAHAINKHQMSPPLADSEVDGVVRSVLKYRFRGLNALNDVVTIGLHEAISDEGERKSFEVTPGVLGDNMLSVLPEGTFYRLAGIPGEILGSVGARAFAELKAETALHIASKHMSLKQLYVKEEPVIGPDGEPRKDPQTGEPMTVPRQALKWHPWRDGYGKYIVAAARDDHPCVRDLTRIVRHPVWAFDADGAPELAQPGYHRASGTFVDSTLEVQPRRPDPDRPALERLEDLVTDFPFASAAAFQGYVGLLLTALTRPLVDTSPLFVVRAPEPGTGKSLLGVDILGTLLTGEVSDAMTMGQDREEQRKQITSALASGASLLVWDNVAGSISGSALAALITSQRWCDRVLGRSVNVTIPNAATCVMTVNNPNVSAEIARRVIPITLHYRGTGRVHGRKGFRHSDVVAQAQRVRADVLAELHGMVQAWVMSGCPTVDEVYAARGEAPPKDRLRLGSFERWTETVDAIMHMHGMTELGGDHEQFLEDGSDDLEEEKRLLEHWEAVHGDAKLPATYVACMAYQLGVPEHFWRTKRVDEVDLRHGRMPVNLVNSFGKAYLRTLVGKRSPTGRIVTKQRGSKDGTFYYLQNDYA